MKSSSKKKYKNTAPLHLLQSSMNPTLRNRYFESVKTRLLQLGLEKLDFKLNTKEQQESLTYIENQLVEEFPNVFYGPHSAERLPFARQAVIRQHCEQRSKLGFARKRPRNAKKDNFAVYKPSDDVLDLTMDDSDEESKPYSLLGTFQHRSISPRVKTREVTSEPRIRSRWTYSTSTSQAGDSSILSSVPEQRSAKAPNASTSHLPATSLYSAMGVNGLNQIHHFLKSCSPSLGYLLSRFVNLGFKSADTLKEVACNWTGEERLELLKKLRDSNDEEISELELVALERRFQKYHLEILNDL